MKKPIGTVNGGVAILREKAEKVNRYANEAKLPLFVLACMSLLRTPFR
jgi:hypothetical protein